MVCITLHRKPISELQRWWPAIWDPSKQDGTQFTYPNVRVFSESRGIVEEKSCDGNLPKNLPKMAYFTFSLKIFLLVTVMGHGSLLARASILAMVILSLCLSIFRPGVTSQYCSKDQVR